MGLDPETMDCIALERTVGKGAGTGTGRDTDIGLSTGAGAGMEGEQSKLTSLTVYVSTELLSELSELSLPL